MQKKYIIIAVVTLVLLAIAVSGIVSNGPKLDTSVPTIKNISKNINKIACEDARWLFDKSLGMIEEKLAQTKQFAEGEGAGLTEEDLLAMSEIIYEEETFAQLEIGTWHDGVLNAITTLHMDDPDKQREAEDAIGLKYLEIYQVSMAVYIGIVSEDEARMALEEEFCA